MPDIHWHVGEDKDQETIAHASAPRRSRRSWIAIGIVVILGAGLGVTYRSLPEPAPRPTPQPAITPTAIPAKLYAVIEREVQALAEGDVASLDTLWNFSNFQEEQQRLGQITAWGMVSDRPLYDILDFGLLSDDSAWVDISQYRNGETFRETRFYRWQNDHWRRTEADGRFWSAARRSANTPHFRVEYAPEDQALVARVMTQLEQDYEQICADFACPVRERYCVSALGKPWCSVYANEYTTTLKFGGATTNMTSDTLNIELPSPRAKGIYESVHPVRYSLETIDLMAVPFSQMWHLAYQQPGYSSIPWPLANQPLVYALAFREVDHLQALRGLPSPQWETLLGEPSDYTQPIYLESLWQSPAQEVGTTRIHHAFWFTDFLEQEFGKPALVKLLQNMLVGDPYKAFPAITGLPFEEVQQRWDAWVKSRTP